MDEQPFDEFLKTLTARQRASRASANAEVAEPVAANVTNGADRGQFAGEPEAPLSANLRSVRDLSPARLPSEGELPAEPEPAGVPNGSRAAETAEQTAMHGGGAVPDRTRRAQTARRTARYRQRERLGIAVLRVPVDLLAVQNALIDSTRLSPAETLERAKVEAEVGQVLAKWCEQWR